MFKSFLSYFINQNYYINIIFHRRRRLLGLYRRNVIPCFYIFVAWKWIVFQASDSSVIFFCLTNNCSLFCHMFIHFIFRLWLYWTTFSLEFLISFIFLIGRRNTCFLHCLMEIFWHFFSYIILNRIHCLFERKSL